LQQRQLVALRLPYEHGISRREIESLTTADDPAWSDRTRTLLTAADELFDTKNLCAPTTSGCAAHSTRTGPSNSACWSAIYVMAAMMLDVAGCEVEPAFRADPR
jgi:hypothetical protein